MFCAFFDLIRHTGSSYRVIYFISAIVKNFSLRSSLFQAHAPFHTATIIILGNSPVVLQAGEFYADAAECNNPGDYLGVKLNQCAYALIGGLAKQSPQTSFSYSGIPLSCSTTTGQCPTTAPTATCFTAALCKTTSLIVQGVPYPFTPPGIVYNMGHYPLKYTTGGSDTCSFSNGTSVPSCTRDVYFYDTQPPLITLLGGVNYIVQGGFPFVDPGATASDLVDGTLMYIANPPCPILPNGTFVGVTGAICRFANVAGFMFNTTLLGNQTIYYIAQDSSNNIQYVTRTITVIDTLPPIITVNTPLSVTQEAARPYVDKGAISIDLVNGNLTKQETVLIPVNTIPTTVPSMYTVTYQSVDYSGNVATPQKRNVTVIDTTAPTMVLNGPNPIMVQGGTFYLEPFSSAFDSFNGDITSRVNLVVARQSNFNCHKSTGCTGINTFVDSFAPSGTLFLLTYTVFDFNFNNKTITRNVQIFDSIPPVIFLNGTTPVLQQGYQV